jgi:hypothetical protein
MEEKVGVLTPEPRRIAGVYSVGGVEQEEPPK